MALRRLLWRSLWPKNFSPWQTPHLGLPQSNGLRFRKNPGPAKQWLPQRAANELEGERQPALAQTTGQGEGGRAVEVKRSGEALAREGNPSGAA